MSSQTAGRPSGVSTPRPSSTSSTMAFGDGVPRAERVRELLARRIQQNGAVGAGGLGNRVALHRRRPRAAVRVVLQRVEISSLRAELERDPCHLAGRAGVVRRSARLSPSPHGSSGRLRPGRRRSSRSRPPCRPSARQVATQPAPVCSSAASGRFGSASPSEASNSLPERRRDRMPRPVAHLEETLAGRAAAAGEPVAAVLARERDSELLEPGNRRRRLGRQHLDQSLVGRLV